MIVPARNLGLFHAHPEEAPLRKIERRVGVAGRRSGLRGERRAGAQSAENRQRAGRHGGKIAPGKLILLMACCTLLVYTHSN